MTPYTRRLITAFLLLWLGLAVGAITKVPAIIQTHLQVKTP